MKRYVFALALFTMIGTANAQQTCQDNLNQALKNSETLQQLLGQAINKCGGGGSTDSCSQERAEISSLQNQLARCENAPRGYVGELELGYACFRDVAACKEVERAIETADRVFVDPTSRSEDRTKKLEVTCWAGHAYTYKNRTCSGAIMLIKLNLNQ